MAHRALRCREARLDVIRHLAAERLRAQPGRLMAYGAILCRQLVVVAHVAERISAGHDFTGRRQLVRTRQCPARRAVIERSRIPALGGVAGRAIRRLKSGPRGRVHRIIRLLPGRQMAARIPAVRRPHRQVVIVVEVAGSASHIGVAVGQKKSRGAVIEDRRGPRNRVVASVAVGHSKSSPCRGVHRIIRLLPSRQVAARIPAVRRPYHQAVIVVEVAGGTGHIGMAIRQREPGGAVVELRAQPAVKRVAGVAGGRELCADVIRIRSLLVVPQVAGSAGRRQAQELAHCSALVAVLALHRGVRAEQRKAILVILYPLDGNFPAPHGMALRAIRAHLPLVNVRVALFTILAHICEHRLEVALRALNFLVHLAQRIAGLVVIEFRNRTNGAPARSGVAILARNGQRSVRTTSGHPL